MTRSEDGWHLVGQSEDEGSERSPSRGPGSRPCTPAASTAEHELGSECPPTPESERLADSVLCTPFGPGSGEQASGTHRGVSAACSSVDACAPEVVSIHCLQGLSQEGSLEGFALNRPHLEPTLPSSPEGDEGSVDVMMSGDHEGDLEVDHRHDLDARTGWQGLDATHLAGMDSLVELLEGLGWTGGCFAEAYRAGVHSAHQYMQLVQQALAYGASLARQGTQGKTMNALVLKLSQALRPVKSSAATGLLVSALGLTTLASLAGLLFFMGRARQLSAALQQRDRELARLVFKILNLQEALQQPRLSGPSLRHTADVLTGLMAPLMFTSG